MSEKTAEIVLTPADRRSLMEALKGKGAVEANFPDGTTLAISGDRLVLTRPV